MANDLGGVWRTVGGRRIFIKDGTDLKTAMKKSGKFKKEEEQKEQKEKPKEEEQKKNPKNEFETLEQLSESETLNKEYKDTTDRIRDMSTEFYKELGYNEKPILVSEDEYNNFKNEGYKEIARGIRGYGEEGKNGEDFYNQYKDGDAYIGNHRVFGSGTYYSYEDNAKDTIERYSNKDGITYTALIDKDAKIISNQKLNELKIQYTNQVLEKANKMFNENPEQARNYYNKMNNIINSDNGILAASLGYDAIDVEDAKYIVSLNRNKIILKK